MGSSSPMNINIGCNAYNKLPGYINVDINPDANPDVCMDALEYLSDVPENTVDTIYAGHFLEHLDSFKADLFLCYCGFALKVGGTLTLVLPDVWKCYLNDKANKMLPGEFHGIIWGYFPDTPHTEWDTHKAIYNRPILENLLSQTFDKFEFFDITKVNDDRLVSKADWQFYVVCTKTNSSI